MRKNFTINFINVYLLHIQFRNEGKREKTHSQINRLTVCLCGARDDVRCVPFLHKCRSFVCDLDSFCCHSFGHLLSRVQKCMHFFFFYFVFLAPVFFLPFTLIHHRLWNELCAQCTITCSTTECTHRTAFCRVVYMTKKKKYVRASASVCVCVYIYIIMLWLLICRLCRHRLLGKKEKINTDSLSAVRMYT